MKTFIDDIIKYLNDKFNADNTLSKKPIGHYAYEKDLVPSTSPFFTVQLLDYSTSSEDFMSEVTIIAPIQINLYGVKMNIGKILCNAQTTSLVLAEKCKTFMEEFKYTESGIVSMRRTSCTPALPYEDGSKAYYTAMRFNIIITNKEN